MSKILQVWKADNFGKGVLNGSQDFFRITPDPSTNGVGAEWGGITGTLSTQTDLQTALNGRLDVLISDNAETSLTGVTAETIVRTYPIPGNSLNDFAQIETFIQIDKASGTGNSDVRIYIAPNSDNTTGAIQLVRLRLTTVNQSAGLKRIHKLLGTNIRTMLTDVNASNTDETNTGLASSIQTYDRTQLRYLHVTISPASTSESHTLWNVYVLGARLKTTI